MLGMHSQKNKNSHPANQHNNFLKDYANQVEELQSLMLGGEGLKEAPRRASQRDRPYQERTSKAHRQVNTEVGRSENQITNIDGSVNVNVPAERGLITKLANMRKKLNQMDRQGENKANMKTR